MCLLRRPVTSCRGDMHSPSPHTARQVLQDAYDQLNGLGEGLHGRIRIQVGRRLCTAVMLTWLPGQQLHPTANVNPPEPFCASSSMRMGWRRRVWTAAASSRSLWRR